MFARAGGVARLHAADFPLAVNDGEFGGRSTALMPPTGSFLALNEYLPGKGLEPGRGLFAPRRIPRPLDPAAFGPARLAHPRPGQVGMQHFFTVSLRPFCLYVVLAAPRSVRARRLAVLDQVLATLRVEPRSEPASTPASRHG